MTNSHEVIPEPAVEAAALLLAEAECARIDRDMGYGGGDNLTREDFDLFMPDAREKAKELLEAAAPHMLVGARGEGDEAWDSNRVAIGANPFKSEA